MHCRYTPAGNTPTRPAHTPTRPAFRHLTTGLMLFLAALSFNIFTPVQAEVAPSGAMVRVGFETKKITAADANRIFNEPGYVDNANGWGYHYVDLWEYIYFDIEHFKKYVTVDEWGNTFGLQTKATLMSFYLQKEDGSVDSSRRIARIAPWWNDDIVQTFPHDNYDIKQQRPVTERTYWAVNPGMDNGIKGWGAKTSGNGVAVSTNNYDKAIDTLYNWEGRDWYRVKMTSVRFVWINPESFYVSFTGDGTVNTDKAAQVCNVNISIGGDENVTACAAYNDWTEASGIVPKVTGCQLSYPCMGFIRGGVEIISGFEAEITPPTATVCPNNTSVSKLEIKRFKSSSTTWANDVECYLEYYTPGTGWSSGTPVSKTATTNGTPYFSGVSATGAPLTATLNVPSAWHQNSRDSVRLHFYMSDGDVAELPFRLNLAILPWPLRFAASTKADVTEAGGPGSNTLPAIGGIAAKVVQKKKGTGGIDTITVEAGAELYPRILTKDPSGTSVTSSTDLQYMGSCMVPFTKVQVFYSENKNGSYEDVGITKTGQTGRNYDTWHADLLSGIKLKRGYYYIKATFKGCDPGLTGINCDFTTDTVFIKVPQLLPAPSISLTSQSQPGACAPSDMMKLTATANQTGITYWEWAVGNSLQEDYKPKTDGTAQPRDAELYYIVRVQDGQQKKFKAGGEDLIDMGEEGDMRLNYEIVASGSTSDFEMLYDPEGWGTDTYILCYGLDEYFWTYIDPDDPDGEKEETTTMKTGFWPWPPVSEEGEYRYEGTDYPGGKNSVFFARYHVGDEAVSQWATFQYDCADRTDGPWMMQKNDRFLASFGISATSCIAKNETVYEEINPSSCTQKDIKVMPGSEVTFTAFISFWNDCEDGCDYNAQLNNTSLKAMNMSLKWQYSTDDGVTWNTWHISGLYGTLNPDDGKVDIGDMYGTEVGPVYNDYFKEIFQPEDVMYDIPTIQKKRIINQKERHRVVLVYHKKNGDCEVLTTDNQIHETRQGFNWSGSTNYIGWGNYTDWLVDEEDEGAYPYGGLYDDYVTVDIDADTPVVSVNKESVCVGETVDLQLEGKFTNNAVITWEYNDGSGWKSMTGITHSSRTQSNVLPATATGANFLTGATVQYHVKVVDAGKTQTSDPVTVTVYQAAKVYIGWKNQNDVWRKSSLAGYCNGDEITIMPLKNRGGSTEADRWTTRPVGVESFYYQEASQYSGLDNKPQPADAETVTPHTYPTYTGIKYYRIVTENHGCLEYSDTATIKINEKVTAEITKNNGPICAGSQVTLQASGTPQPLNKYIWYYGEDKRVTTVPTFTETFPLGDEDEDIVILVAGKIFGQDLSQTPIAPQDTMTCYSTSMEEMEEDDKAMITITTTPTPVISNVSVSFSPSSPLCAGSVNAANAVAAPTSATTGGTYTYTWYKNGSQVNDVTGNTCPIFSGTPAATTHSGTYKVSVVLTKDGCPSVAKESPTATFTVNEVPEVPEVDYGDDQSVCAGTSATLTATVTNFDAGKNTYTYQWKNSAGTDVGTATTNATTATSTLTRNAPSSAGSSNEYYLYVTATSTANTSCKSYSVVPAQADRIKITAISCAGPQNATAAGCYGETDVEATLVCPSGASTIVLKDGSTTLTKGTDYTIDPDPSPTVKSYTITFKKQITAKKTYTVEATLNGNTLTTATIAVNLSPSPQIGVDVVGGTLKACKGANVNIDNFSVKLISGNAGGGYTYTWEHNGKTWTTENPSISFVSTSDSNGTYKLTVTAKSDKNCISNSDYNSIDFEEVTVTAPDIKPLDDATLCSNQSYTFTPEVTVDEGEGVTSTYKWYYTAGNTDPDPSKNHLFISGKDLSICPSGSGCVGMSSNGGTIKARLYVETVKRFDVSNTCKKDSLGPVVTYTVSAAPTGTLTPSTQTINACEGTDTTLKVTLNNATNVASETFTWQLGSTVVPGANSNSYKVTNVGTANEGTYTITDTLKNLDGCFVVAGPVNIKLNKLANPTISETGITGGIICSGKDLVLIGEGKASAGGLTYDWYKATKAQVEAGTATAIATNTKNCTIKNAQTTNAGFYAVKIIAVNGQCRASVVEEKEILITQQPTVSLSGIVADPNKTTVCAGSTLTLSTTKTDVASNDPGTTYTWKWTRNGSDIGDATTTNSYSVPATETATNGTYSYRCKVEASIGAAPAKVCTASAEKTITLTVTKPTVLTGATITGAVTNRCTKDDAIELKITGITPGDPAQTVSYKWYKDGGTTPVATTTASYTLPKALSSNGKYKCEITVTGTAANPCSATKTTAEVDAAYKLCLDEKITAATSTNQNATLAIICQKAPTNSPAAVQYAKPAADQEPDAINEVIWYKMEGTTAPASTETATATATKVKTVSVGTSTSWPLTLTQQEVFTNPTTGVLENDPKSYYVWAVVKRNDGSVITYSNSYRFVKVENPTAPAGTISGDKELCVGTTGQNFTVTADKPTAPSASGAYTGLNTPISNNLTYIWTVGGSLQSTTGASQSANTTTAKEDEAYTARVVSSYTYGVSGLSNTCYDTGAVLESKLTVRAQPTVSLAISAASACANAIPENLTLTATNPANATLTWQRTAPSAKPLTGTGNTCTLSAADIVVPSPGGAAVKNTYTVTADGGVCNSPSATATFDVNSIPNLDKVTITSGATYCNDKANTLTATAEKQGGGAVTSTPTYKWEENISGTWTTVGSNSPTYPIPANKAPGTYQYRCSATMGSGSCTVTVTSDPESYVIQANTVAGTLNQPAAVCSDVDAASLPEFTCTPGSGSVTQWTFTRGSASVTKTNSDVTNPYRLTATDLAALLDNGANALRKQTITATAIVKNGVCEAQPTTATVDIYKRIDKPTLVSNASDCNFNVIAGKATVTFTPAIQSGTTESLLWEYAGVSDLSTVTPSTATTDGLTFSSGMRPKYKTDTSYTVRVKITSTYCGTVMSDPISIQVKRLSKDPVITASSPVCEGSGYPVTATRPAEAPLTWTVTPNGGAATSITVPGSGQTETYTVPANSTYTAPGSYTYTVSDNAGCAPIKSKSVTVTVNEKPVAGAIEAASGGVFCASENVMITNKGGVKPSGSTINWQVCTDTSTYPASKYDKERPNASATANYSNSGFAAGTYFIRYEVPANGACEAARSKWVTVKVIDAPSAPTVAALDTKCAGDDVFINFTAAADRKYEIFADNTTGTPLTIITDAGAVNYKITAENDGSTNSRITRNYYVKVTDPSYIGDAGCGTATSSVTLTVDAKPVGGNLLFANNNKDTVTLNVAQEAQLKLSGATGNPLTAYSVTQPQGGSYGTSTNLGTISVGTNKNVSLTPSHMEKTMFWVVAQNGVCPAVNSDTVVVTVKSANDPTLSVASPICEGSVATLTMTIPEAMKDAFVWESGKVTWERRKYTAGMGDGDGWRPITINTSESGHPTTKTVSDATIKDDADFTGNPLNVTYQYRYHYEYTSGTKGVTYPATLQIDATSKGGTLSVDPAKVCQDGERPLIKLTGDDVVGSIVANSLKSGSTSTAINTAVSGGSINPASVYSVPTGSDNIGTKYYQVQVKNGVCDAVPSAAVAVTVVQKPVAGTLTVDETLCYGQGTATVNLGNDKVGTSIQWSVATSQSGTYNPVAGNDDATSYTIGPLTDRRWVQVEVNTDDEVCEAVSTKVDVKVYDTLTIKPTGQPEDFTVVGTGSATFTVSAETAGIKYKDGTDDVHTSVTVGGYQWYNSNGTPVSGTDYSGATSATLTVANAQNHANEMFYCVVTSSPCSRPVTSNTAKISAMEKLVPGETKSLTDCDCYYPTDPALYFVKGAAGQGKLYYKWQVSSSSAMPADDDWDTLSTKYSALYNTVLDKGDTIIFPAVGKLLGENINWIRALVHDDYTSDWEPTTGEPISVCVEEKPTYTFEGNTVCEREANAAGAVALPFTYTASAPIQDRKITYLYKLPSDAGFSLIGKTQDPNSTVQTKTVTKDGATGTLTFALSNDNLSIPATSAIPFVFDSMIVRMEVRSCYTPDIDHKGTNTDTTIDVLLRVDAPVQITARAQDTTVCAGESFNMETGYSLFNKTIAGNEVSAKWYKQGTAGEQDSKTYPGNADGTAVHAFADLTANDAGTWYVDLSTQYCPVVTDTIVLGVKNAPTFVSVEAEKECAGNEITITALVDLTSSPAAHTITWQRRDRNGQWRSVLGDDPTAWTGTDSIATATADGTITTQKLHKLILKLGSPADAGRYRAVLTITGACAGTSNEEVDVKIDMAPEFASLSPGTANIYLTADATGQVTVNYVSEADLAQRYDVEDGYLVVKTPITYGWQFKKPDGEYLPATDNEFLDLVTGGHTEATIKFEGKEGFSGTWFYATMSNGCGDDTSTVDTLIISDRFTLTGVEGPTQPVCEGNDVNITVTTSGPATYVEWQVSANGGSSWTPLSPLTAADTSWKGNSYTLTLHDVTADKEGYKYRAVVHDAAPVWDTAKAEKIVTLQVFSPKSPYSLTIRDAGDDDMQDGDVREEHQVIFKIYDTVSGTGNDAYKSYFDKLCVMRYVDKDSVEEILCQTSPFAWSVTIPSFTARAEEHDSTLYFVRAYNHCGLVASDTVLLRVYDTLIVRWMADTIIYTDLGDEWSVDSLSEIVPGRLIDVYSKFDSTPMQAHVFLCDSTYAQFSDTTLKGFMNSTVDRVEGTRNSKWWTKAPEGDWRFASPALWDYYNTEHEGLFGVPDYDVFTIEDDGMQIKGWGVNNLYCDSTSVLTIHMLPRLEKGDLRLTPPALNLCAGAPGNDQTFVLSSIRYEGEEWEHAAASAHLHWQYLAPGSDEWVAVDSVTGRTSWHFGTVTAEHDGWRIRAFVSVPCGTDTVEALISFTTPVVRLAPDSVCVGSELVLTAAVENMENPVFEWFVDNDKDASATGAEYKTTSLPAGEHNIEVRARDAKQCAGSDKADVLIYGLPQIKAFIVDTMIKNIDTTAVYVKGDGDYTYVWSPETGLFDVTSDSTLLWGLDPREEPYWYVVTATDENNCRNVDSVWVLIESNFTIDSFGIATIVPPVLALDGGTMPGYPTDPGDSYYPEIGGTPFGGEWIVRNDTIADLWICAHNTALVHFNVRGGEKPITYTWSVIDGNATLVREDTVFGIFFPDTTTHTLYCEIKDKTGAGANITIYVHYYKPETFYLEVTPKVTSGKYYEQQAMNFFVRPDRDWLTTWIEVRNGVADTVTNRNMNRQASFSKEEGDQTSIWISTVDRHGCRIWDSVPIHIIPLPNVLMMGDPINGVLFPEFEVEITNTWGLKVKAFEDRNGNGTSRGWDGRTKNGSYVTAGTYYYRVKIPTLDKQGYMMVNGAVTVVNK